MLCLIDFYSFFTIYVFEGKKSIIFHEDGIFYMMERSKFVVQI